MQNDTVIGYRLSPLQGRLWRLQEQGHVPVAQCVLKLEGRLDAAALQAALGTVASRHESLRTTFRRTPGMKLPLQVIGEAAPEWQAVELDVTPADREAVALERAAREAARPFDFERGPLLRALLLAFSREEHALILTLPALCVDAESLGLLAEELSALYGGIAPASLPIQDPLQYADYAEWHNQVVEAADEEARSAREFWVREAAVAALPPRLPLCSRLSATASFHPETVRVPVAAGLRATVEELARRHGADVEAVLLACWEVLVGRLAAQEEVLLRCTFAGRRHDELRGAVGLFSQPIPVRLRAVDSALPILLQEVRQASERARSREDQFTGADESAGVEFAAVGWPAPRTAGGVAFSVCRLSAGFGPFALKLSCARDEGSWHANLAYDPQAFTREDATRFAGCLVRLLEGITRTPEVPPARIPLLNEAERHALLSDLRGPSARYPDRCIHTLFEEQAARVPQRPALVCNDRTLTYEELNTRANQVAHHLRSRGVTRNVPVALFVERSAEMVVGMLGILKAAGAYVPLHPELPRARLTELLTDTKSTLVLTQQHLLPRLPEFAGEVLCLDRDRPVLERESPANPAALSQPDDLVYVIYTSGSTGTPKGVAVLHRNLTNYAHFILGELGVPEGWHFGTVSTLSADLGNTCIFPALISGGCLHAIDYDTAMDGNRFADYTVRHPLDVLKITPSHLAALLTAREDGGFLPRRWLVLGGESSSWSLVRRVTALSHCAILNHYGPTETTVGSLTWRVPSDAFATDGNVPIGRPIANTYVAILDPFGEPVPAGVPGELYIGGAGVAQGYLNQPERTAERLVADRFMDDPAARLYRTGDLVRARPDGAIEFLGRIDDQIKIRGFRVEPGEVEGVLARHAGVRQAAVISRDGPAGDKRLVAYIVPRDRQTTADAIRTFAQERLPDYMVPEAVVLLESLPLTPNGKVDRGALPDPSQAARREERYVAPRNPIEEQLAAIWKEVLKLERVGVEDDFFELGGHSLLATQVVSRTRSAFGVELSLRAIFETPTIGGLGGTLAGLLAEVPQDQELARLLAELEGLSEEEAQRLLAAEADQ
jgi:amino acid adenylation domain-containing protein